jgi:hypothetical protein
MSPTKSLATVAFALILSGCTQPVPPQTSAPAPQAPAPQTSMYLELQTMTPAPAPPRLSTTLPFAPVPAPKALPPAVIVEEHRHRLREGIKEWNDNMCLNRTGSLECTAATLKLKRLSTAAAMDLENARPWPVEQEELAQRTLSRLKAVSMLTQNETASTSMLHSELLFLDQALQSWSAFSG